MASFWWCALHTEHTSRFYPIRMHARAVATRHGSRNRINIVAIVGAFPLHIKILISSSPCLAMRIVVSGCGVCVIVRLILQLFVQFVRGNRIRKKQTQHAAVQGDSPLAFDLCL